MGVKFAASVLIKIPPHLKVVTALPSKISGSFLFDFLAYGLFL